VNDIPEPWAKAMRDKGLTDRRGGDRPSWRALGELIEVHPSTLSAMASGARETSNDIVGKVADALGVDVRIVNGWVGRARAMRAPYQPPSDADLLDEDEREAVDRMITLLARGKKRGRDAGDAEAQKTPGAGDTGDDVIRFPRRKPIPKVQDVAAREVDDDDR